MKMYAVPMLALVRAPDIAEAYLRASDLYQNKPSLQPDEAMLIDEKLDAFAFDPEKHEIHSALDKDELE